MLLATTIYKQHQTQVKAESRGLHDEHLSHKQIKHQTEQTKLQQNETTTK